MEIIPAILTKTVDEFSSQIATLKKYYHRFQIDIADNKLVPNTTLQIEDMNKTFINNKKEYENCIFDFHLMVYDYEKEIKKIVKLVEIIKVGIIFVHTATSPDIEILKKYPQFIFGLVLNPDENVETIKSKYDLNNIKNILIMTVNPGFQGAPFISESLKKIEQLRSVNYRMNIFIDGGVSDKTIPLVLQKKELPNFLCIGSFLTKAPNLEERTKYLQKIID